MTFQEFQEAIIDRCHEAGACKPEFRRLMEAADKGDKPSFIKVLLDNHWWCIDENIYDAAFFLNLDEQDVLLDAGLLTQHNSPIEFQTEKIGGKLWKPFNEGATAESGIGDYVTFNEANDPKSGRIVPSMEDFEALCALPNEWALYQGQFGQLLDNRLFLPAGGYRRRDTGALWHVGYYGYSWSSSVYGIYGMSLHFASSWLNPSYAGYRAYGFQVRCLQD